jgi:hypothetical protein
MTAVYTLTLRERHGLGSIDDPFIRSDLAVRSMEIIAGVDQGATLALPAGYLQAPCAAKRDEWAEELGNASREFGVSLVFGIDWEAQDNWGAPYRPRSFAFAFDRGRRRLWAESTPPRDRKDSMAERAVTIGNHRVVVLQQNEIFRSAARIAVELSRPDLVMILAYAGATPRWAPALKALDRLAPTLIVREEPHQRRPAWTDAPRGWRTAVAATTPFVTLHRFAVDGDGAVQPAMGH